MSERGLSVVVNQTGRAAVWNEGAIDTVARDGWIMSEAEERLSGRFSQFGKSIKESNVRGLL